MADGSAWSRFVPRRKLLHPILMFRAPGAASRTTPDLAVTTLSIFILVTALSAFPQLAAISALAFLGRWPCSLAARVSDRA